MKYKRQKKVKSILKMFQFLGYEPPYTIVMDGTFSMAALNNKVNLAEQIPNYLGLEASDVELSTTKCVLKELEKLGSYFYGALHILKQYSKVKCAHSSNKLKSASLCLKRLAESGTKCILASQDATLQQLTEKSRVPLLYLHSCTLTLKKPSFFANEKSEMQKVSVEERELHTLSGLKKKEGLEQEEPVVKMSKKKLAKWENKMKRRLENKKRRFAHFYTPHELISQNERVQSETDKSRNRKRRNRNHKIKGTTVSNDNET